MKKSPQPYFNSGYLWMGAGLGFILFGGTALAKGKKEEEAPPPSEEGEKGGFVHYFQPQDVERAEEWLLHFHENVAENTLYTEGCLQVLIAHRTNVLKRYEKQLETHPTGGASVPAMVEAKRQELFLPLAGFAMTVFEDTPRKLVEYWCLELLQMGELSSQSPLGKVCMHYVDPTVTADAVKKTLLETKSGDANYNKLLLFFGSKLARGNTPEYTQKQNELQHQFGSQLVEHAAAAVTERYSHEVFTFHPPH